MTAQFVTRVSLLTGLGAAAIVFAIGWNAPASAPALSISPQLGGETTRDIVSEKAFTMPVGNMRKEHLRDFFFGNRIFNTNWVAAPASVKSFDGLGPIFNRVSCSGCHTRDGRGRPPLTADEPLESMLVRISIPGKGPHGGPNPDPVYGDQLGERALPGIPAEARTIITWIEEEGTYEDGETFSLRRPQLAFEDPGYGPLPADLLTSPRVAPAMIGLGLLEAVPDDMILALADPDDENGDGISGRANRVFDAPTGAMRLGRFGWKANVGSLAHQNAGAALGDIGLTSAKFAMENCTAAQTVCAQTPKGDTSDLAPEFLEKITLYTRLLAVPARRDPQDPAVMRGAARFADFGCAACHRETLQTGADASFPELANQTFHPFTDLLLHDMGDGLADGRPDFEASGSEWRTPPLWGIGLVARVNGHKLFLHDGRARGYAAAILWHGGEGYAAREAFRTAPKDTREDLIAFLKSL